VLATVCDGRELTQTVPSSRDIQSHGDSKLRGCDLVSLKVRDITHGDRVAGRAIVQQKKIGRSVGSYLFDPLRTCGVRHRASQNGQ
jgi:hypothetical protein